MALSQQLQRAWLSLEGLSLGDAFGERFFTDPDLIMVALEQRQLMPSPWRWSDDSAQAQALVEWLGQPERDLDQFAQLLARFYQRDRGRGYGSGAHRLLEGISQGQDWRALSRAIFNDQGSFGNGAAMRMAPLGAYFADDLSEVAAQAQLNAQVTHAHPEGEAGGVAVAVAAATMWRGRALSADEARSLMWREVLARCSQDHELLTWQNIERASRLDLDASVALAVNRLGNGSRISSQDTVGLCLWMVARHIDDFEEAMWSTVSALGDRDTTCAIVGGILAPRVGLDKLPQAFMARREALWIEQE